MRISKTILFTLCSMLLCIGCTQKRTQEKSAETAETTPQTLQVDDLLATAEQHVDKTITVEGVCTHICKHGGKKIFLMGTDDTKTIRVEASEAIGR